MTILFGNEVIDMKYKGAITKLKCERDKNNTPSLDIAYAMAIKALEKQIPKKMNLDYYCGFKSRECPECGYTINLSRKHNYCSNCGQRLE